MSKFEQIWSRVTRVVSFFAGLLIMGFETVHDKSDRPWLYAAAVGMMGLPLARAAEGILGRLSGTGPQVLPSKQEVQQPVPIQVQVIAPPASEQREQPGDQPSVGGPTT